MARETASCHQARLNRGADLESAKRIQKILARPCLDLQGEFNGLSHVDYVNAYTVDVVGGNGTSY